MKTQEQSDGSALFDGLPMPVCLVDADWRLVAMNPSALSFWGMEPSLGGPAMQTLQIVPAQHDVWKSHPRAAFRLPCRITTLDGQVHRVSVVYTALEGTDPPLGALFVVEGTMAELLSDLPEWALRDPVTGLGNRHLWEREAPAWSSRSGCLVFLDLDDLKEVNDLHGHVAGDRLLAAAGEALAAISPPDALTVRYGGDEFIVVLPGTDEASAESWALSAVGHVAAASADLPIVPCLSHGVAAFGSGELRAAVQRADDALYARRGVLLPAASGGRIILTREGRAALRGPGDDRVRLGAFSTGFGPEFEGYFRAQYARALEQAREFVAFVDPEPGSAVVEVGAGSGRITFDGGLAERIGRQGQLLVTDPSGPQLQAARQHAEERGLDWVRFVRAPAEHLPLASGTADLVVGALFLHFTRPDQALREMARVLRPGGRVAISTGLEFRWPTFWWDLLAPVREELARQGLPYRHFLPSADALRAYVEGSGLQIERSAVSGRDHVDFPHVEIPLVTWRQIGLVPLLLREVPADRQAIVQEAFEAGLREAFGRTSAEERRIEGELMSMVARKPG